MNTPPPAYIYSKKPDIGKLTNRVMDAIGTLTREVGYSKDDEDYMQELGDPEFRIVSILRGFIYSHINYPLDYEYINFLENGRFCNETIADRIYMDAPLFPGDELTGDYMLLRNIVEVVGILLYSTLPYEYACSVYHNMIGNGDATNTTLTDCVNRMTHRTPDIFKWSVYQKKHMYHTWTHIYKFMNIHNIHNEELYLVHPDNLSVDNGNVESVDNGNVESVDNGNVESVDNGNVE